MFSQPQVFDIPRLLRESSLQHVEYHAVLPSTNTLALQLLQPLVACSPALVLTAEQTAGRGRKGNLWWSSAGALTFSLVLRSHELPLSPERRPLAAIAAGMAVRDALLQTAPDHEFQLKWPNDVLSGPRKICGILVEQHGAGDEQALIIGIGVNVNNSLLEAPEEISRRAVSLADLLGHSLDLTDVLLRILQRLDARIQQLSQQPRMAMSDANRCSVLNGRLVSVQSGDGVVQGVCAGIDEDGLLVLQTDSGIVRCPTGVVSQW
jgi:BirA family biotin operon repressor/biotin-[acetyl-CoA-carboxylase] ligase